MSLGLTTFVQTIIYGLMMAGLYAMLGVGVSLIFGVMRIMNFAHGELLMLSMYLCFVLSSVLQWDPLVSLFVAIPAAFLLGCFLEKVLIQRVLAARHESQILLTYGLAIIFSSIAQFIFSPGTKFVVTPYSNATVSVFGILLNPGMLLILVVAVLFVVGLQLLLQRSDLGRMIRASAQNRTAALLMGINVNRIYMVTFGIASALAAAAGALLLPTFYVNPHVGGLLTFKAFTVSVLGGLGNPTGAIYGSIVLGLVEALGQVYISPGSKDIIAYSVFILVLLFRPSGIMGVRKV